MLFNGVRHTGRATTAVEPQQERDPVMALSLRSSIDRISDPASLDEAVHEVFQLVLGAESAVEPPASGRHGESVTAVVGFGGILSGACVLQCSAHDAIAIASQMTGAAMKSVDDTVQDAIGEICNMVAGAWKGKVPELAAHCGLSVPAVISGRDYNLHVQAPEFLVHHGYAFTDLHFEVTIVCDGLR